jgi:tetratricopeptide (TPR) repeat protein
LRSEIRRHFDVEVGRQLAWRSAVVPVPARGRVRVYREPEAADPRQAALDAMTTWCRDGDRPLWLVEGAAGTGKTRLAADVADLMVAEGWPAGWARPGMSAYAVSAAVRNGRRALVLVDDAETRADLFELLRTVTGGGRPLAIRVILCARDFGTWWHGMLDRLSAGERHILNGGRTIINGSGVAPPSARALALREVGAAQDRGRAVNVLAMADPATPAILLRQAAVVVALSTRVGDLGPAEVRAAQRDLFEEEEGYWRKTATEVANPGQAPPALRSALNAAAVVAMEGLNDTATVLRRVPALALGAADRLARLAVWWHSLYGRVGETSTPAPRLPSWLADRMPSGGADRTGISWTVATLTVDRQITSTLAQMAIDVHRDVWLNRAPAAREGTGGDPAAARTALRRQIANAGPVDEALAWLTQELELSRSDLDALSDAIAYPAQSLSRTAIVLARRQLQVAETDEDRAHLMLTLGARYSELGLWHDARHHTELAVAEFRLLVDADRERMLPDYASAVSNLASCLAQLGERDEALQASYQAVGLHRELLESDRNRYLPELGRSLTNLSACLSRSGRRPAALGAAGQAVAIYRELVGLHPNRYLAEMAAAEHNWRVCRGALGQPVASQPVDQF